MGFDELNVSTLSNDDNDDDNDSDNDGLNAQATAMKVL